MSAPYSPHQNGTTERNWRTLFEMARCMITEKSLPKTCGATLCSNQKQMFQQPSETNPMLYNRRKLNLVFGSICYAYKNLRKKLYPKCKKGVFVGYGRNSPSYLIFYPENKSPQT